jgi:hypothetical protein
MYACYFMLTCVLNWRILEEKVNVILDHWEAKFYDLHMAICPQAKHSWITVGDKCHSCITGEDKCQRSYLFCTL